MGGGGTVCGHHPGKDFQEKKTQKLFSKNPALDGYNVGARRARPLFYLILVSFLLIGESNRVPIEVGTLFPAHI